MGTFFVDKKKGMVMATTSNSAFQLWNEGIVGEHDEGGMEANTWYPVSKYGWWVLENEFPNYKQSEFIDVKIIEEC